MILNMWSIKDQQQYEAARVIPTPILAKALLDQAKQSIAYSEADLLKLAGEFNNAAETARSRRMQAFKKPTGFLPDMKD